VVQTAIELNVVDHIPRERQIEIALRWNHRIDERRKRRGRLAETLRYQVRIDRHSCDVPMSQTHTQRPLAPGETGHPLELGDWLAAGRAERANTIILHTRQGLHGCVGQIMRPRPVSRQLEGTGTQGKAVPTFEIDTGSLDSTGVRVGESNVVRRADLTRH